jgi:hypothetical protein
MTEATKLIAQERQRQINGEGWTAEHDALFDRGELVLAAMSYALFGDDARSSDEFVPPMWPWSREWWKPNDVDEIRHLVKAGALIAAEIDRRLAMAESMSESTA